MRIDQHAAGRPTLHRAMRSPPSPATGETRWSSSSTPFPDAEAPAGPGAGQRRPQGAVDGLCLEHRDRGDLAAGGPGGGEGQPSGTGADHDVVVGRDRADPGELRRSRRCPPGSARPTLVSATYLPFGEMTGGTSSRPSRSGWAQAPCPPPGVVRAEREPPSAPAPHRPPGAGDLPTVRRTTACRARRGTVGAVVGILTTDSVRWTTAAPASARDPPGGRHHGDRAGDDQHDCGGGRQRLPVRPGAGRRLLSRGPVTGGAVRQAVLGERGRLRMTYADRH